MHEMLEDSGLCVSKCMCILLYIRGSERIDWSLCMEEIANESFHSTVDGSGMLQNT